MDFTQLIPTLGVNRPKTNPHELRFLSDDLRFVNMTTPFYFTPTK